MCAVWIQIGKCVKGVGGCGVERRGRLNYLDLSGSRAFGLLLHNLWVFFPRLLDEGEGFIHHGGVVDVGGHGAGGAGGRAADAAGCGALRPVEDGRYWWCRPLCSSDVAPAEGPLSPGTAEHIFSPLVKQLLAKETLRM